MDHFVYRFMYRFMDRFMDHFVDHFVDRFVDHFVDRFAVTVNKRATLVVGGLIRIGRRFFCRLEQP